MDSHDIQSINSSVSSRNNAEDDCPMNFDPSQQESGTDLLSRKKTNQSVHSGISELQRIITRASQRAGALGPLENPIDAEIIQVTNTGIEKQEPDSFNELDKWKYPIEDESGIRLVTFVENDPEDPRNWSQLKKWTITMLLGLVCFDVALASSIITGGMRGPMETFHVSMEVSILAVTLFVIGFGVGPVVFSPLSEEIGRRPIYCCTLLLGVIFIIPCAVAKNIGTLLVCRLIDGIAFSAPITLIGGSLSDIFLSHERGTAMAVFSAAPFLGPVVGPLIGGYIYDGAGWRWLYWVTLIMSFVVYIMILPIPETHHQTILQKRKNKLIELTGDKSYKILKDLKPRTLKQVAYETVSRPIILLTELIVLLITLYMSIIYGLLYMYFFAFPVVFSEGKGWSDGKTGLIFIAIAIGIFIATAIAYYVNKDYNKRASKFIEKNQLPPPELRLIPMMYSCWLLPIGLFIFAWTSYPSLIWVGPAAGAIPCGIGFLLIYNSANNYIVDSYQHYAASALASKTLVRSIHGATCVLYTVQMMHRLGDQWAISLLAFISLACCGIPYFFYFFGARVRKRSRYAYSPAADEFIPAGNIIINGNNMQEDKEANNGNQDATEKV